MKAIEPTCLGTVEGLFKGGRQVTSGWHGEAGGAGGQEGHPIEVIVRWVLQVFKFCEYCAI